MKRAFCLLSLVLLWLPWRGLGGEPEAMELRAVGGSGEFEFDEVTGTATGPAGVEIQYGDTTLSARELRLNRDTGEVSARGDVRLQRGTELWVGDSLQYNFLSRQIGAEQFRAGMKPFYTGGVSLQGSLTNQVHSATNAFVTTDDFSNPSYRVRTRNLTFVPGQYIEARHATLCIGSVPIFYFPKYRYYFDGRQPSISVTPGYRTSFGPYLYGRYNWFLSTNVEGTVRLDYRLKRGPGVGLDLASDLGPLGTNELRTYYTHDNEPGTNSIGQPINPNRWLVSFGQSTTLQTNLTVKAAVNAQSDEYVVRDFFLARYRSYVQPQSFLEGNQLWPNFSLDFLAQGQLNDFWQTVDRVPDAQLTATRQQLGISPFFYESVSSLAYLRRQFAYNEIPTYAAARGDTFHQILLPQTFFGWLNVSPRIGGRFTYYGEEQGEAATLDSEQRWVMNTGAEVSTKAARLWPTVQSRVLQLNGLRHIVEPSINYVYVPDPSVPLNELPQFDYDLPSFTLRPIDFPDNNNIDSITSQNVMRFGLRNRLQTKRADGVENVANWSMVMDWRLDPPSGATTFSDLYSLLDLRPRSWILLSSEVRYAVSDGFLRMANNSVTFEPNDIWSWRVGQRYLLGVDGMPQDTGNNLFFSSLRLKLNEDWSLRAAQLYDFQQGYMQEQAYTVQRDFRSWTAALVFRLINQPHSDLDFTVAFMVSLKAFPRYSINSDRDYQRGLLE